MDFKKLYTPTEATALYNVAKIKFDPTSYSLRGNLITNNDLRALWKEHIQSFNYGAERHLVGLIQDAEGRKLTTLTGISTHTDACSDICGNEWAILCIQQDNLHISLELLSQLVDLRNIKSTNVLQTIVTMCVALNSTKSCAKDMLCLALDAKHKTPYDKVHNFEDLRDALNTKGADVEILWNDTTIDSTYVPTWDSFETKKLDPFVTKGFKATDTLYNYLINSLEVLWAWYNLPDVYKDCFAELCSRAQFSGKYTMEFFNPFLKFTGTGFDINPDVLKAISIDDPKERYTAYQDLANSALPTLYNHCKEYYIIDICDKKHFLNATFVAFTSFITQLGITNMRINTIRILHEYCVAHKYITAKETVDSEKSPLESRFGDTFGTGTKLKASKSKDLVDFSEPMPYGKSAKLEREDDDGAHDDNAMFEALDKVKASFSSGKYRFDVTDVMDDDEDCKRKYNAIAKKVDLVNKLLIKRIKDIKTYNVGGKNSGASSGRLDRKVIYRYKYDPNIFYNNTYKTLESDLAFGIILDESGSMSGKGIENGRVTMVVLHETLKALGINHSIIGHTSDGKHHSDIYRYQAFQEDKTYRVCKNYGIIKTEAKSGNCDSGALYYMEKALDRVRNRDKICLIFSDGAPTECTGTELKEQVRHMEKKGIKVIGIGINFASIAKYYTDYANGRNLTDMLNIVAKILEEYVLKKKDK